VSSVLAAALLGLLAGCSSPVAKEAPRATFYPAAPLPPRLQLLASFSNDQDLGGGPGKFASFVVGKEPVRQAILKPYGVAVADGKIFVCDTGASGVDILDLQAKSFRTFTSGGESQIITPINIAVDRDGTRYITDTARGQVLIFGSDDSYKGALGERFNGRARAHGAALSIPGAPASGDDEGMKPTDVQVHGDRLYVSDLKNHCVRVYGKQSREFLFTIPKDPATADAHSKLFAPTNLAVDTQGRLYVSDLGAFRVQQYSPDGTHLRQFGTGAGDKPGEFSRPKGIAVDREGRLYVVDAATQVVQLFDAQGQLLLFFGEMQGQTAGLDLPAKVAVDYDHTALFASYAAPDFQVEYLVIVTSQVGDRKVSVFGFGHRK
jgi:sugar lactone lactonase YvrE